MGKRSHGEGSISKRNNGTWLAQVSIEGRRVSKTFKTRKEALEWVTATTRQVKHGLTYSSAKTTLDELLESWLILKKNKLRPATEEFYRRLSRLYISPFMGKLKLQEITAARIQAFYEDMERRGIGKRTIEGVHITLHGLLSHAHRLGLVAQIGLHLWKSQDRNIVKCQCGMNRKSANS